ncbi:hypothetical protein LINPERPRIM_LOCUS25389 [Linum perenne]
MTRFSAGARFRKSDQSLRVLRIRGWEICISNSDWFADAAFRISVNSLGSEHFVFLDLSLLHWVHDVLQEALQKGWKLGKERTLASGSRSISVGSFFNMDVHYLRITEVWKVGKRFFVAIPMDDDQVG